MTTKPTNPKDAIGSGKLPLHLVPAIATAGESLALMWGAMNYGRANWRDAGVRYTIYTDAIERHLGKLKEGQDWDSESGLHHLWHIRACTAILLDADAVGMLTDDRVKSEAAIRALDALGPQVVRIRAAMEAKRGIDDPGAHAATAVVPNTSYMVAPLPPTQGEVLLCKFSDPEPVACPAAPPGPAWAFEVCESCQTPLRCMLEYTSATTVAWVPLGWTCLNGKTYPAPPRGARIELVTPT